MNQLMKQWFIAIIAILALGQVVFGQSAADSSKGSINITVRDASGATVADSAVSVEGAMGQLNGKTNDRGEANFFTLVPGTYKVKASKTGFSTAEVADVIVQATQRSSVNITLQAGQVTTTVEVEATSSTIDTSSTTIQTSLNSSEYQSLPIGRNVTNLFYLAPGVADGGGTGKANPSISGASGLENQYVIDGINDTDAGYGGFGVYSDNYGSLGSGVNFDFIKEVQIKTGGFEAQYGQAMGGIVNIVTNSGGNDLHGSVYGYSTPYWAQPTYNQVNVLRTVSPQTEIDGNKTFDYGVNLGGRFIKDKFFWYGAFNPSYTDTLREAPAGYGLRALGEIERERRSLNWVGKLNYNINDSHRLEATAYADPSKSPAAIQGSLLRDNSDAASSLDYGTRNWAVKYSGTFGPQTLVSASFAWNHSYFNESPLQNTFEIRDYTTPTATGAAYTLRGALGYLGNNDGNNKQTNVMFTRNVNLFGSHQIDIGYSYNDVTYDAIHEYTGPQWALPAGNGIDPSDVGKMVNGGYFYEYANRTVNGTVYPLVYRLIRGTFSNPNVSTETKYQDAFVQDAWQVNRFLTVKAGVRWEQQKLDGTVNQYTLAGNWAPRIGFIVDPIGHGKTKIFGNWGYFFEKIPQDLAVRAMSTESSYLNGYLLSLPNGTTVDPVPGTTWSASGVSPTIIYGGTKAAYQQEVAAGIEQELKGGIIIKATFTDRTLKRGLEDTSGITAEQALAGAPQQYVIQNPSVHSDTFHNAVTCVDGTANCTNGSGYTDDSGALGPDGKADGFPDMRRVYNAFELSVSKRFAKHWALTSNYRLAKLFGNYEGSFRNDNDQSDPNITSLFDFVNSPLLASQFAVGVLPTDRRSIVNLYASYMLGTRWNFGFGYTSQSGTPITELDAHPVYENAGEIPVGARGALGRTPWQNYFNVRGGYELPVRDKMRLKFAVDTFNIFNRQTTATIDQDHQLDPSTLNADFLKPLTYHQPFSAQFSARFEF